MPALPSAPKISAVIVTLNEGPRLRGTVESFQATLPPGGEILVVDDGSDDGSTDFLASPKKPVRLLRSNRLGVAKARNYGGRHARGDVIVFSDAHMTMQPGWWKPMLKVLENPAAGAVAPVISDLNDLECKGFGERLRGPDLDVEWMDPQGSAPYRVPLLPGAFWAMRRDVFKATGGFDDGMVGWGSEDNEFSLRLWLLGYELWLTPQVDVAHYFQEFHSYTVEWSWVLTNKLRLAFLHFNPQRISQVVEALREYEGFGPAVALTIESDFPSRRADLAGRRRRDDAWFFDRFDVNW